MGGFKRFFQVLFTLIFVIALFLTLSLFYEIPGVTDFVNNNILSVQLYRWIMAGILALIFLVALIMFFSVLFSAKTKGNIVKEQERGHIKLTKDSIEAVALRVLDQYKEVHYPKVRTKLVKQPKDTEVYVSFDVSDRKNVLDMAADIQAHIIDALEATLGLPINHVEVRMLEVRPTQTSEAMEKQRKASKSRVQ